MKCLWKIFFEICRVVRVVGKLGPLHFIAVFFRAVGPRAGGSLLVIIRKIILLIRPRIRLAIFIPNFRLHFTTFAAATTTTTAACATLIYMIVRFYVPHRLILSIAFIILIVLKLDLLSLLYMVDRNGFRDRLKKFPYVY